MEIFNNLFPEVEVNSGIYSAGLQSGEVDIFHWVPTLRGITALA